MCKTYIMGTIKWEDSGRILEKEGEWKHKKTRECNNEANGQEDIKIDN